MHILCLGVSHVKVYHMFGCITCLDVSHVWMYHVFGCITTFIRILNHMFDTISVCRPTSSMYFPLSAVQGSINRGREPLLL